MSVHVKISTTLRDYVPAYNPASGLDLEAEGNTAASLARELGIPAEQIKFVMINGRHSPLQTKLVAGDRVAYFPAVGGG